MLPLEIVNTTSEARKYIKTQKTVCVIPYELYVGITGGEE
jgi:hypothetical protein